METQSNDSIMQNKVFIWIVLVTILILIAPLIAMQFTSEVDWDLADFIVTGALLFGIGSLFVLVARMVTKISHRIVIGILFAIALLYIWAELAVGVFTNLGS